MVKIEQGGISYFKVNGVPYQRGGYEIKVNGDRLSIVRISDGIISDDNIVYLTPLSEWVDENDNPFATLGDFFIYIQEFFYTPEDMEINAVDVNYDNSASGASATNVQTALDEAFVGISTNSGDIANNANEITNNSNAIANNANAITGNTVLINNHINKSLDAHAATAISYNNALSGLSSDQVQGAIDEIAQSLPLYMLKSVYDPENREVDVYDKANETGIEQITGDIITPPSLGNAVNDYSPVGFDTANMIRQAVDENNTEITGMEAPQIGVNRVVMINNISVAGNDLRFTHNDAASVAENRFLMRDNGQRSIRPNETASFWYDHISERWRPYNRVG